MTSWPTPQSESEAWKLDKTGKVNFSPLASQIEYLSRIVETRVSALKAKGSAISVADMFDLQAAMNKLSQYSEAASGVIAGLNSVANSISRNIKG